MKKLSVWPVIGMAVSAAALSGCGSSGDASSDTVSVRLANATLTHPSLDLLVNAAVVASATAADTVSGYAVPGSGGVTLQVDDAGAATALATNLATLAGGYHFTLLAYESGGTVKITTLGEDVAAPVSGAVTLRIVDAAPEAGKLDVYVTDPSTDLATVAAPTASFGIITTPQPISLTYSPGTYRVRVTGAGNKSDLRLDLASVVLTNQEVATVALTPASGGQLLNGSTIVQQGAYAATRNTNTRVRLASAVAGGATVAASASSGTSVAVIDSGSVAPAFGYYTLVPASSSLNITVGGTGSVGAPATPLVAGSDMTLFVYGSAAGPTATLLADDNRTPSDPTTVKLRLINGITGSTGTLTLTANSAPVASGIAPGAASGYVAVAGSTSAITLGLNSSQSGGAYYSTGANLNANTVYTVLASGAFAAPQLLIR